jgi:hypothetical protein
MSEYSRQGYILLNGLVLTEAGNVKMRINSNDKPVRTLTQGLAGFSNGAEECSVEFSNAIPLTGFEAEFNSLCRSHTTVRVGFRIGNKQYECEGRFMDTDTETSVDNPNAINVTFNGKILNETVVG